MTERTERTEQTEREESGRVREEILLTHKGAYERLYRRRYGKEPPNKNLPRVTVLAGPDEQERKDLAGILFAEGAVADLWIPGAGGPGAEGEARALLVSAAGFEEEGGLEEFRRLLRRAIGRSWRIAGLGQGVSLLVREGFLGGRRASGPEEEKELFSSHDVVWTDASVVRDGPFLTCRDADRAGDLAEELLGMIRAEGEEER